MDINKFAQGLSKLDEANRKVDDLSMLLDKKKVEINIEQRKCDELIQELTASKMNADQNQKEVERDAEQIKEDSIKIEADSAKLEGELGPMMIDLASAEVEVQKLTNATLSEVKTYSKPPELVMKVLAAVMTLLQKPTGWEDAKKEVCKSDFLSRIMNFDRTKVGDAIIKKVEK